MDFIAVQTRPHRPPRGSHLALRICGKNVPHAPNGLDEPPANWMIIGGYAGLLRFIFDGSNGARHKSEAQLCEYTILPDDFFQMLLLLQSINLDSREITP